MKITIAAQVVLTAVAATAFLSACSDDAPTVESPQDRANDLTMTDHAPYNGESIGDDEFDLTAADARMVIESAWDDLSQEDIDAFCWNWDSSNWMEQDFLLGQYEMFDGAITLTEITAIFEGKCL